MNAPSHTIAHEINGRRLGHFQISRRVFAERLKTVLLELAPRMVVTRCEFHYATDAVRQTIQPHQFGHDASKGTTLWLHNLPKLTPTGNVPPRIVDGKPRWANQTDTGQNRLTPGADRWRERSRTYQGIAEAMAAQWGIAPDITGWKRVSFACDCDGYDEESGELGDICSICGLDYCDDCECPGPTQDGMEYETFDGVLYARPGQP